MEIIRPENRLTNNEYRWHSGCLLASRLSSAGKKPSVLLVEAGGDGANIEYRNPYERFSNQLIPVLDYSYKSMPQKALGGAQLDYYRGRGLGGTSLTNFLV
jgi:choline dehydrogenase